MAPTWPTLTLEAAMAFDATAASPTFNDLSSRLLDFSVTRGRDMELDEVQIGALNAILRNHDRALDPANTAGTFYPNVLPVRQARLKANVLATNYDVFRGDIPDWPQQWDGRVNTVPIQMVDGFDALQIAEFTASRPEEMSGDRVAAILDAIGWQSALRTLDAGQRSVQAVDYENANVLQAMQDVAAAEGGVVFMSKDGKVTFHDSYHRLNDTTINVVLSNTPSGAELPLADAKVSYKRERIRNDVAISQSGTDFVAYVTDATSKAKYRQRSVSETLSLAHASDVQALAEYMLSVYKDPVLRVDEVTIEPGQDDNLWQHALGREIGDRIQVKITPPGSPTSTITSNVTIEGISHAVNGAAKRWQTTFRCSPTDTRTYWRLDDATYSELDSTFMLAP